MDQKSHARKNEQVEAMLNENGLIWVFFTAKMSIASFDHAEKSNQNF